MGIINLEQGSESWKQWRMSRITATDTPIILGSNPWKTKLELWEEKLGWRPPPELNDAMRQGILLEPLARALAIKITGINFTPVVFESDDFKWMASSLDGLSDCGKVILELKCPSNIKLFDQCCEGFIPEYYEDQIQHQLTSNSKVELVLYGVFFRKNSKEFITFLEKTLKPEKQEKIIEKGYEFYMQMCQMQPPEEWKLKERK